MKLPIVRIGAPVIRRPCRAVDDQIRTDKRFPQVLKSMVDTMRGADGVGLAANQIGLDIRAIVLECRKNRRYPGAPHFKLQSWLNPRIVEASSKKKMDWEGCLSIPGYRGLVPRHSWVVVEATDLKGRQVRRRITGFEARVFQHEIDHINGRVYVDRMPNLKAWFHEEELNRLARAALNKKRKG